MSFFLKSKMSLALCVLSWVFLSFWILEKGSAENLLNEFDVESWLQEVDETLLEFNSMTSHLSWILTTNPNEKAADQIFKLGEARSVWKKKICESKFPRDILTKKQKRKIYLLCRGPIYDQKLIRPYLKLLGKMAEEYNSEICLPEKNPTPLEILKSTNQDTSFYPRPGDCLRGEPHLERLIQNVDLNPEQKEWIWTIWHNFVGPKIKKFYPKSIAIQNKAARNNGYNDMGEIWREELEIPNLEQYTINLYNEIKPLYLLLHAVARHKLYLKYGPKYVNPRGPIPVHLLGNMWGQDWSSLIDLFIPLNKTVDLDKNLLKKKWNVTDLVLQAEDMYISLGLPKMTQKFWDYSIFEEKPNATLCHGTAANMYKKSDFRILLCGKVNMEDFQIIHHEIGHIQYYMAYENQPAIFQEGSNSALHESIGDAVTHGFMTPQHLHRLNLITDEELSNLATEYFLLFRQALSKIPELPFALVTDLYRWNIFNGKVKPENYNRVFWDLNRDLRGIVPPRVRSDEFFDAGAKFHIPDNTPYVRYFLSGIFQMKIFKSLCEFSMFDKTMRKDSTSFPLHKCDIYGSKKAGKRLREMMEKGASINWFDALKILTENEETLTDPFLEFYKPVYNWLNEYVTKYNVYIGW